MAIAEPEARKMGSYILGDTLGEGGFSKVKLGTNEKTKQRVALKILKKDKLKLSQSVKRQVEREIAAMEKIQHPNVIRLYEVDWDAQYPKKNGKVQDVILVVLELATGGELFEFLSFTGCFEETIARTYFHQLIEAVEACHSVGVAHRDLKPENLLLDSNFNLKLADFGFSVVSSTSGFTSTECGTPGYMAPEMFGHKGYDPMIADIWACGVILFIMIAGFPPFQRPSESDWWFNKLLTKKHALFWQAHSRSAYFSQSIKDLINKILNPDPQTRITIEAIKKHEWYNDPTIKESALTAELQRRKATVDEEKNRQKLAKMQKDVNAHHSSSIDDPVTRGDALGLPDCIPSFSDFSTKFDTAVAASSQDISAFVISGSDQKLPPAQEYEPDGSISCYTRFSSKQSAQKIMSRITDLLTAMNTEHSVSEANYKIKAQFITDLGTVAVQAQIYTDPSNPDVHICEFRRRKGDSMQYRAIYTQIRSQLQDLLYTPQVSTSQ